jgi:hypothetical protein
MVANAIKHGATLRREGQVVCFAGGVVRSWRGRKSKQIREQFERKKLIIEVTNKF